jgi:cbb3-type cytochrome oxidase subunit 3
VLIAAGIATLAIAVALCLIAFVYRAHRPSTLPFAMVVAVIMTAQFLLASAGVLRQWDRRPPPFVVMFAICLMLTIAFAFSPVGRRLAAGLSFVALVGFQAFRFPLELVLHQAAADGIMPVQMSFSGYNFDILSGILAIPVAWLAWRNRAPRGLIIGWNILGSALLLVIVAIAVASTPGFAVFGPDRLNTWIADPPYVWLPGVLVPSALLGHLLLWRKLTR